MKRSNSGTLRSSPQPGSSQASRTPRLFVDRQLGKITSLGLWETRADLIASVRWNQDQVSKFASLFSAPPSIEENYELAGEV